MGRRLRFTIEIRSRDIQQIAGRPEWRVTFSAHVIGVCAPDA